MAKYFNFRVNKSNINTLSTAVPKFHYQSFLFSIPKNVAKGPLNFNHTDVSLIVSLSIDNLIGVKKTEGPIKSVSSNYSHVALMITCTPSSFEHMFSHMSKIRKTETLHQTTDDDYDEMLLSNLSHSK